MSQPRSEARLASCLANPFAKHLVSMPPRMIARRPPAFLATLALFLGFCSVFFCRVCEAGEGLPSEVSLLVSVADQKMVLCRDGNEVERFSISTSRFGLGDKLGSYATPTGSLQVAEKIGDHVKEGTVFKERRPTREVLPPDAPGRDPIVTRILWLRGLEQQNANSFKRFIYIHGTPEERMLGRPVSWGCIRMASKDVVKVFEYVNVGTRVEILNKPLKACLKEYSTSVRLAQLFRD